MVGLNELTPAYATTNDPFGLGFIFLGTKNNDPFDCQIDSFYINEDKVFA